MILEPHQEVKDPRKTKWYRIKRCLVGNKFGRWEVLLRGPNRDHFITYWCKCECGYISRVDKRALVSGKSKSCGCLKNEINAKRSKERWVNGDHKNGRLISMSSE